jgi:hypothetical protein
MKIPDSLREHGGAWGLDYGTTRAGPGVGDLGSSAPNRRQSTSCTTSNTSPRQSRSRCRLPGGPCPPGPSACEGLAEEPALERSAVLRGAVTQGGAADHWHNHSENSPATGSQVPRGQSSTSIIHRIHVGQHSCEFVRIGFAGGVLFAQLRRTQPTV